MIRFALYDQRKLHGKWSLVGIYDNMKDAEDIALHLRDYYCQEYLYYRTVIRVFSIMETIPNKLNPGEMLSL